MSFIISRGYAEVKILKQVKLALSLELFGSFLYAAVQILKKVKQKWTFNIFVCKKVQLQGIILLCVT